MKRLLGIFALLLVLCVLVVADDLRFIREDVPNKHVVGPGGIYMMLSYYNRNLTRDDVMGYECELSVFTPEFKDPIKLVPNAGVTIFVVRNDVITEIITLAQSAPKIPEDGYLVIGHGRASYAFMPQFAVGDKVEIRDYTPKFSSNKDYKEWVIMPNGSEEMIAGWNRGRCADEVVAYNADYADKTYTNEWGFEFSVERDEVIETRASGSLNFMPIPPNGFVISAHGVAAGSISFVYPGDFVELD